MREDVREALDIPLDATLEQRTIDIRTTGRRTGEARRIEICFYRVGDDVYLSGIPAPRTRDWLHNLAAHPRFTFHLKHAVVADLPADAEVITDPAERERVLTPIAEAFARRRTADSPWPEAPLADWLDRAPLARVTFPD